MTEPGRPAAFAELFARVVAGLKPSLPFDDAELAVLDQPEGLCVVTAETERGERRALASAYSARLWCADGAPRSIADTALELDAALEEDRRILERGSRSLLLAPLHIEDRRLGLLVFSSRATGSLGEAHLASLAPVVELLAAAIHHEQRWALEQARQSRRAKLERLLPTLAEALDVRQVFLEMSSVIQEIVPHDVLAFALLTPDRLGVRIQAATDAGMRELPEYRFTGPDEALDFNWKFLLAGDLTVLEDGVLQARISARHEPPVDIVLRPGPMWTRFIATAGIRSSLRVPIRAKDRPIGGVGFFSRQPFVYDEEDGALASRIADHLALALAHQELAEEERRIAQAEERAAMLEARVDQLSRDLERFGSHRALGQSGKWKKILTDISQVAATDTTVLVTGESGTGKEVVARSIHRASPRAKRPFVALNCAALPEQLLESELFGHEKGAFTGALAARAGKIEQAEGGVLFLDEVGEMSPLVQAKFLRVLQEREYQRLGGSRTLRADIRVVAATNRDPRQAIAAGAFREDLYYRLSVFEIHLPPLRERPEDILVLAEAFLDEIAATVGRPAAGISEDARAQLLAHAWPGNVRELRNAMERAVILCQGGLITGEHLPMSVARAAPAPRPASAALSDDISDHPALERDLLIKALARCGQNKTKAAQLLKLSRGHFYTLLRRHGLTDARR